LAVITIGLMMVAPFTSGNLSSGEKEDRSNRWVFTAFSVIALLSAIVPPYTDRISLWTIDGEKTRWVGIALYTFGGGLRLWPVFVLGERFSGLVAIQPGHTLETRGVYGLVRNPSYLGMLINMLGWGWRFVAGQASLLQDSRSFRSSGGFAPKSGSCARTSAQNTKPIVPAPGASCPAFTSQSPCVTKHQ
jgi:protein-S-isoprenylcysteine O-methyltransferase Ste14